MTCKSLESSTLEDMKQHWDDVFHFLNKCSTFDHSHIANIISGKVQNLTANFGTESEAFTPDQKSTLKVSSPLQFIDTIFIRI